MTNEIDYKRRFQMITTNCPKIAELRAELLLKKAEACILSEECIALQNRSELLNDYIDKLESKVDRMKAEAEFEKELNILKGKLD